MHKLTNEMGKVNAGVELQCFVPPENTIYSVVASTVNTMINLGKWLIMF